MSLGTVADRLKFLRGKRTQAEFARRLNVTQQYVSKLELGGAELSREMIDALRRVTGVSANWLLYGEGEPFPSGAAVERLRQELRQVETGRGIRTKSRRRAPEAVPVSQAEIVAVFDVEGGYDIDFNEEGRPISETSRFLPVFDISDPLAFAVELHGDSMTHPGEQSFKEGDILVVSPAAKVQNKDFVLARVRGRGATFKQVFFHDRETLRLHPLNPDHADLYVPKKDVSALWKVVQRIQRL